MTTDNHKADWLDMQERLRALPYDWAWYMADLVELVDARLAALECDARGAEPNLMDLEGMGHPLYLRGHADGLAVARKLDARGAGERQYPHTHYANICPTCVAEGRARGAREERERIAAELRGLGIEVLLKGIRTTPPDAKP